MGTVSAKDLFASLERARNMGLVEEKFDLCGHALVVRNLRPNEIEAVLESCKGLEDLAYFNTYQREHVARGLCELDGFDLRAVDFIDDEEPDPKKPGQVKKVRVECHRWIADKFLTSWGPEVILIAYRKIGDCTAMADKQAKDGVTFIQPDETPEQKYRRILGELKEAEDDMPDQLLDRTLEEFGFARKSTLDELKAADERLNKIRDQEIAAEKAAQEAQDAAEKAAPAPPPPVVPNGRDLLANRRPMNREEAPPPEVSTPLRPVQPPGTTVTRPEGPSSRAAELAAIEGDADSVGILAAGPASPKPAEAFRMTDTAVLGHRANHDPEQQAAEARSIIDPPVQGGINPRFRPPSR